VKKASGGFKKILTPEFRVSFPHLFKKATFEGKETAYEITMLFPKGADLSELKKAVDDAVAANWDEDERDGLKLPFHEQGVGKHKDSLGHVKGALFAKARTQNKPGVVDGKLNDITEDSDEIYGGAYARATVNVYTYKGGVSLGLLNVQKTRDAERFGNKTAAKDDFGAVEDDPMA